MGAVIVLTTIVIAVMLVVGVNNNGDSVDNNSDCVNDYDDDHNDDIDGGPGVSRGNEKCHYQM